MDGRKIPYEQKKKGLIIILQQKCDVIEQQEHGHSNSKTGENVGMPEPTI